MPGGRPSRRAPTGHFGREEPAMSSDGRSRARCRSGDRCAAATPSRSPSPAWPRPSSSAWWPRASGCRPERELAERLQVSRVTLARGDPGPARGRLPGVAPGPHRRHVRALRYAEPPRAGRGRSRSAVGTTTAGRRRAEPGRWSAVLPRGRTRPSWPGRWATRCTTRSTSGGSSSPGRPGSRPRRTLSAGDRQHLVACLTESRERDPATRRVADSRLHLAIAAASGSPSLAAAHRRRAAHARPAAGRDPGAAAQPRPLRRPAHPHRRGDPGRRRGRRPGGDGGALRRHGGAAARLLA